MWKNKHAGASAKIKGKAKAGNGEVERRGKGKGKGKGDGRRKEGRFERDGLGEMEEDAVGDDGNSGGEDGDAEDVLFEG